MILNCKFGGCAGRILINNTVPLKAYIYIFHDKSLGEELALNILLLWYERWYIVSKASQTRESLINFTGYAVGEYESPVNN